MLKSWKTPVSLGLIYGLAAPVAAQSNLPLTLPGPVTRTTAGHPRIAELQKKNEKFPTYAAYREMAEIYLKMGQFAEAAQCLRTEAAMYRQKGLIDAAILQETRAARYETDVRFFLDRPLTPGEFKTQFTKAPAEPPVGAYIGAFIDRDDQLAESWQDENWQTHRRPKHFVQKVGKPHASYFMYLAYGQKVPLQWLQECKEAGAIPHLAWEPKKLTDVKDDAYLRDFAKACGELQWPIFLRYASEMNGKWTPYNGNPTLYREKFRLVHRVFKQYAPQVATVWCVNSVPREGIPNYYPGDDACDWVGINVYSVPFYDNNPKNPAFLDSPLALIDPIYKLFKDKKPMAICEYAASQMAAVDKVKRPEFAIEKMSMLYSALPRLYPRIKMINWFNMNTMKHAAPGRQLNNYSLTEDANVLKAYRNNIASPYFIGTAKNGDEFSYDVPFAVPRPLSLGQSVDGVANFSIWVKSYVPRPKVYIAVDGKVLYAGSAPGAQSFTVDTRTLQPGRRQLMAYVFDDKNRFVSTSSTTFNVSRGRKTRGTMETVEPMLVSGTVQRFYADRSGLVTALELETPGETAWVHFPPYLAQQLLQNSPIGATAKLWLMPHPQPITETEGASRWNLVGIGEARPDNFLTPAATGDLELLDTGAPAAEAPQSTLQGRITNVVTNNTGAVLALILDNNMLVRIPATMRGDATSKVLWTKEMAITATVQPEAAREGALSNYANRYLATTLSLDGQDVSLAGVPPLNAEQAAQLFGPSQVVADVEPSQVVASQLGLKLYQLPISERRTRGNSPAPPDVEPLVAADARPW
jgi:hypothetical protein